MADLPEFNIDSPRSYRGEASDTRGHCKERNADGKFASEGNDRKRWTTTLRPEALDQLHAMSKQLKIRRCEVVERLLLHPQAWRHLMQMEEGN